MTFCNVILVGLLIWWTFSYPMRAHFEFLFRGLAEVLWVVVTNHIPTLQMEINIAEYMWFKQRTQLTLSKNMMTLDAKDTSMYQGTRSIFPIWLLLSIICDCLLLRIMEDTCTPRVSPSPTRLLAKRSSSLHSRSKLCFW